HWQRSTARVLEGNGYFPDNYISCLTVAFIMLMPQIALLMPLYVTLVGGDLMAKEAEDGTLRMILCRPISRFRLGGVKWLAGALFSALLVVCLGVMALGFARLWFPWGDMFIFVPMEVKIFNVLPAGQGLALFAAAHLILAVNACTMFSLAFMFSCFNVKPAAATILAMSLLLVCFVLENMPFFEEYKDWMITHHLRAWVMVFARPVPLPDMLASLSILLGVNATAFVIGVTAFQTRDIKS
ncbi:MAG: ABC transporter permease subunit, partial [Pedosphaera parvula]|nr:ABC transporter permease subunit [Pedosphaera parvula]